MSFVVGLTSLGKASVTGEQQVIYLVPKTDGITG